VPELPEVETVRRGLAPVMEDKVILDAQARRPDLRWPLPERFAERLRGRRVTSLGRRSKYLLAHLDSEETLLIHLGMSGRMLVSGRMLGAFHYDHPAPERHDHVVFDMEGGARITFNDARRFGAMDLSPTPELPRHWLLAGLGPEPLEPGFGAVYLAARLRGRQTPIKSALLDQRIVAGLGNIYVCEALHRAGVSPLRLAGDLGAEELRGVEDAVRRVLAEAILAGGSSLRDHRQTTGELGYFQHDFRVYDREGAPCPKAGCTGIVRRVVQSGRSSFYCPQCQV